MTSSPITIRRPVAAEAALLRALRLQALEDHPEAFLISAAEEARNSVADFEQLIGVRWQAEDDQMLVAVEDRKVIGMCGFFREAREKIAHRMTIWGVYVHPAARGRHVGRLLVDEALARIKGVAGIRQIHISVTPTNTPARNLYKSLGFVTWGIEPASMCYAGEDLDEEHMVLRLP